MAHTYSLADVRNGTGWPTGARFALVEASTTVEAEGPRCQNCGKPVSQPHEGCVLHDLVQVLRERAEHEETALLQLHAAACSDAFWAAVGPIVDMLGEGRFDPNNGPY